MARLFSRAADALVVRAAAFVQAALRRWFGERVVLGRVRRAGPRVHLEGARLSWGEATLHVDAAELRLEPRRADVVEARVSRVEASLAVGPLRVALRGDACVALGAGGWTLEHARFEGAGLRIAVQGRGPWRRRAGTPAQASAHVAVATIDEARLAAALRKAWPSAPRALRARADVGVDESGLTGTATVACEGTDLAFELRADRRGALDGSRVRGVVDLADFDQAPLEALAAGVDLALSGTLRRPALRGEIERIDVRAPALAAEQITVDARIERGHLRVEAVAARALGGRAQLRVEAPLAALHRPISTISFAGVDPRRLDVRAPPGVSISGELARDAEGRLSGEVLATTHASRVRVEVRADAEGALDGTRFEGDVAFADLLDRAPMPWRPLPPGALHVEGVLRGDVVSPRVRVHASTARCELAAVGRRDVPTVTLESVTIEAELSRERAIVRKAAARFHGGAIACSGEIDLARGRFDARLEARGVRVEDVPTLPSGERELAEVVHGALALELALSGGGDAPVELHGRARLQDPHYRVLEGKAVTAPLARFGLAAPPARGLGPAQAKLRLSHGTLHVDDVFARVAGIDVRGAIVVRPDGALRGALEAHLLDEYLRRSVVLAVPGALARKVVVPIVVRGTARAPAVSADLVGALGRFAAKNRVSEAVRGVVSWIDPTRKR